ncbi:response regulator [Candidatus Woesearchaeota archaeon]|nr:response regulator [Candidatus Woesearchaeota archaeon]
MATILCLEDESSLARMYLRIFKELGEVALAQDGQEGFDKFTSNPNGYALILTDNDMPRRGGLEFLKAIRDYSINDCPIKDYSLPPRLMLSATSYPQTLLAAVRETGALGLYQKPFTDVQELKTIARELIEQGNSSTLELYLRKKGWSK